MDTDHRGRRSRHLDMGCGAAPRNPYRRDELHAVDLRDCQTAPSVVFRTANLTLEPIPYADGYFDSVSAFDFLEHVPRILMHPSGQATRFPLIELMSEVWRVLVPGGRFYALTPCYPNAEAFRDPTHVNIMTDQSHEYFCGERPYGANYGFVGRFETLRAEWVVSKDVETAGEFTLGQRVRRLRRMLTGRLSHMLWEFEAIKGNSPSP